MAPSWCAPEETGLRVAERGDERIVSRLCWRNTPVAVVHDRALRRWRRRALSGAKIFEGRVPVSRRTGLPNVVRRCALSGLRRHRQYEQVAGVLSPHFLQNKAAGPRPIQRSCLAWCAGGGSSSAPGTSHARSASQEYSRNSSSGFLSRIKRRGQP